MQRVRITATANGAEVSEKLRRLASIRRDLYIHSPVEIDPDNPAFQTRKDEQARPYFEFSTEYADEVCRVLKEFGHADKVTMEPVAGPTGEPCLRCGHIDGDTTPTVCPQCGLREISPCPHCGREVRRGSYTSIVGDQFRCPHCGECVRLRCNDPLFCPDGSYNEPVIVVEQATQQPA